MEEQIMNMPAVALRGLTILAGDDCPFRHQQRALSSCCRGGYGAGSKDLSCHTKECGQ